MDKINLQKTTGGLPDIAGFSLGEARRELLSAGAEITSVVVTAPPRLQVGEPDDNYRVIRWTQVEAGKIELLVCKPL